MSQLFIGHRLALETAVAIGQSEVRGRITVAADLDAAAVEAAALADQKVAASLAGATPKKVIVIPGRMVNIVA